MSNWVHIIGALYVETYKERKNIKKYVENVLKDAPKITGSEEDVNIFVNVLSGYNLTSYKNDGSSINYQTCICITLAGDLRDRTIDVTEQEYNDFLKFIEEKFAIIDSSVKMYEEYSEVTKLFQDSWYKGGDKDD